MERKGTLKMMAAALLGFACVSGAGPAFAGDASSSSECVNCHTDLGEMDRYGAAAASGAAAIAG